MKNDNKNVKIWKGRTSIALLVFLEIILIIGVLSIISTSVFAGVGQNVTVITRLEVGNVYPEIINVTINNEAASLDLFANSTVNVTVTAAVRDYNGDGDLNFSNVEFFDNVVSGYGNSDDNNTHYANSSCILNRTYGGPYEALVTCVLQVQYYANNATWNGTFFINDTSGLAARASDVITINTLLALGLPNEINYGTVNATSVSDEQIANVTNFGNAKFNITLEGYGATRRDGLAMNCTLGAVKNISLIYERYNLTTSNTSVLGLSDFNVRYTNLTNYTVTRSFNLDYRQNEGYNEAVNASYWRIYVPIGVAGNCSGNIIFGATRAAGN